MSKVNLPDIGSLANPASARQAINDNFQTIEEGFDNTLSRDGTAPNQMEADIDLNDNDLLNVKRIDAAEYYKNGVPWEQSVTYGDVIYDLFSGDGVEDTFTLSEHPGSIGNLDVSIDGVTQRPNVDYVLEGQDVRFVLPPLTGSNNILVRFAKAVPTGLTIADSLLYTPPQDGIPSNVRSFLDRLWSTAVGSGAALIRFIQNGVGAVATELMTKLRRMEVNAEDFGVVANGVTDDAAAFEKAIIHAGTYGKRLVLPEGTPGSPRIIACSRPLVIPSGLSSANWLGGGEDKTVIKYTGAVLSNDLIALIGAPKFIHISGIRFDQNNATTVSPWGMLGIQNGEDIVIDRCNFVNFDKMGLAFNGCRNWKVTRNKFTRSSIIGASTSYNQAFLVSDSAQPVFNGEFSYNTCVGSATDLAGYGLDIHHNDISGWGFGAGVTIEQTANTHSNSIHHNRLHNSLSVVDVNGYRPGGIENWGSDTAIYHNEIYANAGAGMDQGGQRSRVWANICYNNGQNAASAGIVSRYGNATYNANGSSYWGNRCLDTQGVHTQTKGYEDQSSSLSGIMIANNQFNSTGTTPEVIIGAACEYFGPCLESDPLAWDPPSVAAGASVTQNIIVPGASPGDYVEVSFDKDLQGLTFTGYVTSTNTVVMVLANNTGAPRDVISGFARARTKKPKNYTAY